MPPKSRVGMRLLVSLESIVWTLSRMLNIYIVAVQLDMLN